MECARRAGSQVSPLFVSQKARQAEIIAGFPDALDMMLVCIEAGQSLDQSINRVAKVVKGGRRFSFTALVVIGDGNGRVGLGYGKAKEVPLAIQKGTEEARRNLFTVPMAGGTVIHEVLGRTGGGRVMIKPAASGTGVIAGGAARVILEEAGVHDVLCKSLGSANHINVARATVAGLKSLQRPDQIAARRGLPAEDFVPKGLLNAYNERNKKPVAADAATPAETGATS